MSWCASDLKCSAHKSCVDRYQLCRNDNGFCFYLADIIVLNIFLLESLRSALGLSEAMVMIPLFAFWRVKFCFVAR